MKTLAEQRRFWRNILAVAVAATVLITGAQLASAGGPFTDVPVDHPFANEISEVAAAGIAQGFSDGTYRPSQAVTRQAMAAFLARAGSSATQLTGVSGDGVVDTTTFETVRNLIANVPGTPESIQRVIVTGYVTFLDTDTAGCAPCTVAVRISGATDSTERTYTLWDDAGGEVRDTVIASHMFTVSGGEGEPGNETFNLQARIVTSSAGTAALTVASTTLQALVVPFSASGVA